MAAAGGCGSCRDRQRANYSAQLNGTSCASSKACLAVGVSVRGLSYAERDNGVSRRLTTTQNPA